MAGPTSQFCFVGLCGSGLELQLAHWLFPSCSRPSQALGKDWLRASDSSDELHGSGIADKTVKDERGDNWIVEGDLMSPHVVCL